MRHVHKIVLLAVFCPVRAADAPGILLWSADFETGDTSQWYLPGPNAGDLGGGQFNSRLAESVATTEHVHSGNFALKMTITAPPESGARMFRWLEPQVYTKLHYSAWFYFPQQYSVSKYWNIFQWKSKLPGGGIDPFFVLNVANRSDGSMYVYLYNWQTRQTFLQSWKNVPVGQWTRIEADYVCAGDNTGSVTFWQDSIQLFDVRNVRTRYSNGDCQWSINNYSDAVHPSPATIYIDDVGIWQPGP